MEGGVGAINLNVVTITKLVAVAAVTCSVFLDGGSSRNEFFLPL